MGEHRLGVLGHGDRKLARGPDATNAPNDDGAGSRRNRPRASPAPGRGAGRRVVLAQGSTIRLGEVVPVNSSPNLILPLRAKTWP